MKIPPLYLTITGIVILAATISMAWWGIPKIIESQIKDKVRLVNGSETWSAWQSIAVPLYLKFKIFNVTNPEEIEKGGKVRVTETGPYTYLERRTKVDIKIDKENDTVRYRQPVTYFFDKDKSNGGEDDLLTVLNMVYVGVVEMAHGLTKEDFLLTTFDDLIKSKGEKLFRTQTVRELLFDGFSVQNFLELLSDPVVQSVGEVKIPSQFARGKFGFFEGRNGSDEGIFEVRSGVSNFSEFGQIVSWNKKKSLPWWSGTCNSLSGTDGTLFRPFLEKSSRLNLFTPDLCRSMHVTFDSETSYEGVPAYRFSLPKNLLQAGPSNPENHCFCKVERNETFTPPPCRKSGVLNLAPCKEGSPIIASSPHFLDADEDIVSSIDGISPNSKMHKTYLDLEPRTGLVLRAAKRLQFNMQLKRYEYMPTFENVQPVIFPMLWVEETAELVGNSLDTVQMITQLFQIMGIVKWVLIGIGAILLTTGIVLSSLRKAENTQK